MMKKLLLLWVVLGFCSSVTAAGHVELRIAPDDVNLAGYQASDTITIQIYATGFYTAYPNDTIGYMDIAAVLTDSNGTASAPSLYSALAVGTTGSSSPGDVINAGGVLIEDIRGYIIIGDFNGVYPFPAVLWECEFHIPDVPLSSIITISLSGLSLKNVLFNPVDPAYTVGEPLEIRMAAAVCSTCAGDQDEDGTVELSDMYYIAGRLTYADYLHPDPQHYIIVPGDPYTGFLWEVCMDYDKDGDIDLTDLYTLAGHLTYADYLHPDPQHYEFVCGDPNIPTP